MKCELIGDQSNSNVGVVGRLVLGDVYFYIRKFSDISLLGLWLKIVQERRGVRIAPMNGEVRHRHSVGLSVW